MLKVITDSSGYNSLTAACDIRAGTVMSVISGDEILDKPARYTIQTDRTKHTVIPDTLMYTNHVCRTPNSRFDFTSKPWAFVSVRDIEAGALVTYDYVTTEYISGEPFDCKCGATECRGTMKGFQYLSGDEKEKMINGKKVSPVIEWLHQQERQKQ